MQKISRKLCFFVRGGKIIFIKYNRGFAPGRLCPRSYKNFKNLSKKLNCKIAKVKKFSKLYGVCLKICSKARE